MRILFLLGVSRLTDRDWENAAQRLGKLSQTVLFVPGDALTFSPKSTCFIRTLVKADNRLIFLSDQNSHRKLTTLMRTLH